MSGVLVTIVSFNLELTSGNFKASADGSATACPGLPVRDRARGNRLKTS